MLYSVDCGNSLSIQFIIIISVIVIMDHLLYIIKTKTFQLAYSLIETLFRQRLVRTLFHKAWYKQ